MPTKAVVAADDDEWRERLPAIQSALLTKERMLLLRFATNLNIAVKQDKRFLFCGVVEFLVWGGDWGQLRLHYEGNNAKRNGVISCSRISEMTLK